MKKHDNATDSGLSLEKKLHEEMHDIDGFDIDEALSQWEDVSRKISRINGKNIVASFIMNFSQLPSEQSYNALNQFLNEHADILADVPLDALCEQSSGVYQVKLAHFPAIAQQIQEEVELYTDAATYDLFQRKLNSPSASLPSDTSDSSYSPREAFSPLPTREFSRRTHRLKEIINSDDNAIKRILDRLAA